MRVNLQESSLSSTEFLQYEANDVVWPANAK